VAPANAPVIFGGGGKFGNNCGFPVSIPRKGDVSPISWNMRMWIFVLFTWLVVQLPLGIVFGRFIGCPQKCAKPTKTQEVPVSPVARAA
jgi:hypothetical protein